MKSNGMARKSNNNAIAQLAAEKGRIHAKR